MAYNDNEVSSASGHDEPWIQWFCGLKGHEMFCEVERTYIEDGFNLYGLRACVSNFSDCLDLILDRIGPDDSDDSQLTQNACTLYGLIHARYITTAHGLDSMYNKYAQKEFGTCPLIQCSGQPVLPVGLKDEMGQDSVKIFCPKCQCVYHPPPVRSRHHSFSGSMLGGSGGVDGASFGTTFPHLFLMTFSNLVPDPLPLDSAYIPRVFGFRVHASARQRGGGSSEGITPSQNTQNPTDRRTILAQDRIEEMDDGDERQSDGPQGPHEEKEEGDDGEARAALAAATTAQTEDLSKKDVKKRVRRNSKIDCEATAEKNKRKPRETPSCTKAEEESTENGNGNGSNQSKRQKRTGN
mmetsp:Transcript_35525/g.54631  ORF Transcript_35525/g.54631 Transcript_35525/m.54631 type:complete len:353 (-) Transcript_35525:340-1398(-)